VALTARPCHPASALPGPGPGQGRRAAGRWPLAAGPPGAGRAALGPCAVCASTRPARPAPARPASHTASTASHTASTASQHTASVCHVCHQSTMAHMAHTCARVCLVGRVCHYFQIEVARQTWKSYTIHTVIIYSIYIFKRPIHLMAHMAHIKGFLESQITPAP